ncbi:Aldo/keto reductase [Suhomyces tanzawaensis NRRL Y-17324]|uniref:2-dehydropantolactone reductase n=1 Tax=Suhomyces tanzawaensis NRRL Y-17324 TaxID=984487 RepID=A0A1E4SCC0_9ASCO|nr:Aldo/keto reductase [Suhomyces tanzawaensis NRRL Y-17324]ODV77161.1 Aldo/keto reductase [Suhomyces tanzawaensis NRRL Y-17324]
MTKSVNLIQNFTTKSGKPITFGTGTGTKWQNLKKSRDVPALTEELVEALLLALKLGYNHIDGAEIYTTHEEIAEAVKRSGIAREDLFISSKYNPGFGEIKSSNATEAIDKALKELNTEYLDLYLIHAPFFTPEGSNGETVESAWQRLIDAKKAGKVRNIGVSNFRVEDLERTFKVAGSKEFYPKVNQIEFHPYLQNQSKNIVQFAAENEILTEAYGPLSPLFRIKKDDVVIEDHPLVSYLPELSKKYGKTPAQILLRYTYQKGILPVTTSSQEERIKQSLEVYNFELEQADIDEIDRLGNLFHFRGFFIPLYEKPESK